MGSNGGFAGGWGGVGMLLVEGGASRSDDNLKPGGPARLVSGAINGQPGVKRSASQIAK